MYNEYLEDVDQTALSQTNTASESPKTAAAGCSGGGLGQLLSSRLSGIKLDMDTLIAFAVIWFLLSDGSIVDTDLLILIGVLLLLGI